MSGLYCVGVPVFRNLPSSSSHLPFHSLSASPPAVTLVLHRIVKASFAVFSACSNQRFSISADLFLAPVPESGFQSASLLYRWPGRTCCHHPVASYLLSSLEEWIEQITAAAMVMPVYIFDLSATHLVHQPSGSSLWVGFCNICLSWLSLLELPEHIMLK